MYADSLTGMVAQTRPVQGTSSWQEMNVYDADIHQVYTKGVKQLSMTQPQLRTSRTSI